jgi:hypothetical protein
MLSKSFKLLMVNLEPIKRDINIYPPLITLTRKNGKKKEIYYSRYS